MEKIDFVESHLSKRIDMLRSHALRFTRDVEDANDLVQETLLKALRFHSRFEPGTNTDAWLFTILRNTFINNYRSGKKAAELILKLENTYSPKVGDPVILNAALSNLALRDLKQLMDRVPELYSQPFLMYFSGYKYQEIATAFDIPLGTIKTRIRSAREILKFYLRAYH